MPSYIFPECAIVAARARGVQSTRKPAEKMHAYAARVMGVPDSHIRFSVASTHVYVHYTFPDLLQRSKLELATTIVELGISAATVAQQILVLPPQRVYSVLLFVKNSPRSYAVQMLATRFGIAIGSTWQHVPSTMTRLLLNRLYTAAVGLTRTGLAAADANPDGFSVADFSAYFSTSASDFGRTLSIIKAEQHAAKSARTYRILVNNYAAGILNAAKRKTITACLDALAQKHCRVHADDVVHVFAAIHTLACSVECQAGRSEVKTLARIVVPAIMANAAANIEFNPNFNTPWWLIQLLHVSAADMVHTVLRSNRVTADNARFILAPYQPQYLGRWPRALHPSVIDVRRQLAAAPRFNIWQAALMQPAVQLAPWTELRHRRYPKSFNRAVFTITLCTRFKFNLPAELLRCILKFCFPSDFLL